MTVQAITSSLSRQRLDVLLEDVERRIRGGERGVAAEVLASEPQLTADAEAAIELLYAEFAALEAVEGPQDAQAWLNQFPDYRDRLQRLLAVHAVIGGADDTGAASAARGSDPTRPEPFATHECEPGRSPRHIGPYEILGELGRGGMGVVYKARHRSLGRLVALKMIRSPAAGFEELQRLRLEAETAARLNHPHMVSIFEVGQERGCPYLALEYVEGGSLADAIARQPPTPRDAARIAEIISRATAFAHERGVVHRDLKPVNILLTSDGSPKIADFGLAKSVAWLGNERLGNEGAPAAAITQAGALLGTPCYMAPEQAEGDASRVGTKTDVYALGAILYELLTRRPPFRGDSPLETLQRVRSQEPAAPRRICPDVPKDLDTICLKCLEKSPHHRYASAEALADDLQRFLDGEPIAARPVGQVERVTKWARRQPLVASLVIAVLLSVLAGFSGILWQWRRAEDGWHHAASSLRIMRQARNAEARLRQSAEENLYFHQIAEAARAYENRRFGEAEKLLAQLPAERRRLEWHLLDQLTHREARRIDLGHTVATCVAYQGDGRQFAVGTGTLGTTDPGQIRVYSADGNEVARIEHPAGPVMDLAYHPHGGMLAVASAQATQPGRAGLTIYDPESNQRREAPSIETPGTFGVAYSPDGNRLATAGSDTKVRIWNAATLELMHEISGHEDVVTSIAFSPDGRLIASGSRDHTCRVWTADRGTLLHKFTCAGNQRVVAFSPLGDLLASSGSGNAVHLWNVLTGRPSGTIRLSPTIVQGLSFTPDGTRLLVADSTGAVGIYRTTGELIEAFAGHRPGGTRLAIDGSGRWLTTVADDRTIKTWDLANRTTPFRIPVHVPHVSSMAFSPDGTMLAVSGAKSVAGPSQRDFHCKLVDIKQGRTIRVLSGHQTWSTSIAYSPDGRLIAAGAEDGAVRVWRAADGADIATIHAGGTAIVGLQFLDGERLAAFGAAGEILIWDTMTRDEPSVVPCGEVSFEVNDVAVDASSGLAALASPDGTVHVWSLTQQRRLTALHGGNLPLQCVAIADGGRRIAAAANNRILLWQRGSQGLFEELPLVIEALSDEIRDLQFERDAQRLVSLAFDGTLRIWDCRSGGAVLSVRSGGESTCLAMSADNELLAASSGSGVQLWNAGTDLSTLREARGAQWYRASAQAHIRSAAEAMRNGDFHQAEFHYAWAERRYDELIARPDSEDGQLRREVTWLHYCFARLLADTGRPSQAREQIRKIDLHMDEAPDALSIAAWGLVTLPEGTREDYVHARKLAQEAVRRGAHVVRNWHTLAMAELRCGHFSASLAALTRARELDGGDPLDWLGLAAMQRIVGNPRASAEAWDRAWQELIAMLSPGLFSSDANHQR